MNTEQADLVSQLRADEDARHVQNDVHRASPGRSTAAEERSPWALRAFKADAVVAVPETGADSCMLYVGKPPLEDTHMTPARDIATRLHVGHADSTGRPHIEHLAAVVGILLRRWPDATDDEVASAWLHDALSDISATSGSLRAQGVSRRAVSIIEAVSRPGRKPYLEWIAELATGGDVSAIRVQLAYNEHNSDPARRVACGDFTERRYCEPARRLLEAGLRRREQAG